MSHSFRLPSLTAADPAGQLAQLQQWLSGFLEELNWAMGQVSTQAAQAVQGAAPVPAAPEETFSSIKSLIIKSADIVQSVSQKVESRLEGKYLARSDFGTFTQETAQAITETSERIDRAFTHLQTVQTALEGVESTLVGVNAYLRAGLLYYDAAGVPVYGLEVGQQTQTDGQPVFNKYARFTAGKLSFYDANDNEVAYISDYKLSITNVHVTGTLRQGHLQDEVLADGSIVTRYVTG